MCASTGLMHSPSTLDAARGPRQSAESLREFEFKLRAYHHARGTWSEADRPRPSQSKAPGQPRFTESRQSLMAVSH